LIPIEFLPFILPASAGKKRIDTIPYQLWLEKARLRTERQIVANSLLLFVAFCRSIVIHVAAPPAMSLKLTTGAFFSNFKLWSKLAAPDQNLNCTFKYAPPILSSNKA
jgi:hypothetical protein